MIKSVNLSKKDLVCLSVWESIGDSVYVRCVLHCVIVYLLAQLLINLKTHRLLNSLLCNLHYRYHHRRDTHKNSRPVTNNWESIVFFFYLFGNKNNTSAKNIGIGEEEPSLLPFFSIGQSHKYFSIIGIVF